jgi:hypothetical protein
MPRTPRKKPKGIAKQRNLVRGMLGAIRGTGFKLDSHGKQNRFLTDFQRLLLEARKNVPPGQYEEYLDWLAKQMSGHAVRTKPQRLSYATFPGIRKTAPMPLESELLWIAARLSVLADQLTAFSKLRAQMECAVVRESFDECFKLCDDVENLCGVSLWLIEIRVALLQVARGLESQKTFAQHVKDSSEANFLRFVVHWTSVRNEPTVSSQSHKEQVLRGLRHKSIDEGIRTYFRFRLLREFPTEHDGLAHILRNEQSQSPFDLLNTFLGVLQRLIVISRTKNLDRAIVAALKKLSKLEDPRLTRLRAIYLDEKPVNQSSVEPLSHLLMGNFAKALRTSKQLANRSGDCISGLLVTAISLSSREAKGSRSHARGARRLALQLSSLVARSGDHETAGIELARFAGNFAGLSIAESLGYLTNALRALELREIFGQIEMAQICGPFSALDMLLISGCRQRGWMQASAASEEHKCAIQLIGLFQEEGQFPDCVTPSLAPLVHGVFHYVHGRVFESHRELSRVATSSNRALFYWAHKLLLECDLRQSDIPSAISRMAHVVSRMPSTWRDIPVTRAIGDFKWESLEGYSSDISLPISLDVKWRQTQDDYDATLRRFACEDFLGAVGVDRPSSLEDKKGQLPLPELIQFLRFVCTANNIDMLSGLDTSESVDLERREIVALLTRLDPSRAEEYRPEILEISGMLRMREGLRFVDSSRVYVDTEAHTRWAQTNLKEPFARYSALVQAGVGVADDFEEVIRRITKPAEGDEAYLEIPKNEADDILGAMVRELRDQFLLNPSYGLNSYLSRRVRHGTIVGYLRSPVEVKRLITQRDTAHGGYRLNTHWTDKLLELDPQGRKQVGKYFRRFSEDYDKCLVELRDERFHVRDDKHAEGLFEIPLSPVTFHLVRSFIRDNLTLHNLVTICHAVFWGNLEKSLSSAQSLLRDQTKTRIVEIFSRLQADLLTEAGRDSSFPELSAAVAAARREVQAEIDRIAEWFKKPEVELMSNKFPLDHAVGIAVESAKAAHKTLAPEVNVSVPPDVTIVGSGLLAIVEIVFTALDNAYEHSAMTRTPRVQINAVARVDSELVDIEIRNEVGPGARSKENEEELEKIRSEIQARAFDLRVPREGGSGLIKIAAAALYDERGSLEFGFEDREFVLRAEVPILIATRERAQ